MKRESHSRAAAHEYEQARREAADATPAVCAAELHRIAGALRSLRSSVGPDTMGDIERAAAVLCARAMAYKGWASTSDAILRSSFWESGSCYALAPQVRKEPDWRGPVVEDATVADLRREQEWELERRERQQQHLGEVLQNLACSLGATAEVLRLWDIHGRFLELAEDPDVRQEVRRAFEAWFTLCACEKGIDTGKPWQVDAERWRQLSAPDRRTVALHRLGGLADVGSTTPIVPEPQPRGCAEWAAWWGRQPVFYGWDPGIQLNGPHDLCPLQLPPDLAELMLAEVAAGESPKAAKIAKPAESAECAESAADGGQKRMKESVALAGLSLEWACRERSELALAPEESLTQQRGRAIYDHIREYGCPQYGAQEGGEDQPRLPNYDAWQRYVREYRRLTQSGPVNSRRAGRPTGRSIVGPDDL